METEITLKAREISWDSKQKFEISICSLLPCSWHMNTLSELQAIIY